MVRSLRRQECLWGLLLFAFVLVAYVRVIHAGFIWDDESHLTRNPTVVGPLGLKEIWTTTQAVYYPLVLTTFWALHKVVGLNPLPYHLLTVILHAASAILLWRVLKHLQVRGAWLGAAIWALHPVMVQSVAWITELKNTQSCAFYLLSILFFLRWEDQRGAISEQPYRRAGDSHLGFTLSVLFFLLATLSKSSVVMLPVVLALCIWWRQGRMQWRDGVRLVPFLLISVLAAAWTIWEQRFHSRAVGPDWAQTFTERLLIAGRAIWFYLGKLVWPHQLIFIYPRWEIHPTQPLAWLPLLAAMAGLVVLWLVHRSSWGRILFFATTYYVVSLFPVLGFFSVYFYRYSFVSDHFQYLASMGPHALVGAGITVLVERLTRWCPLSQPQGTSVGVVRVSGDLSAPVRSKGFLALVLCSVPLFLLVVLTWQQTAEYRNLISLYTATLKKNPACWMAQYNLGIVLSERGDTDQAIEHYREAISLRSDYTEAHYNLGRLLAEQGHFDDAIAQYQKTIELDPTDPEARNNLGVILFGTGRVDDAVACYRKALEIQPDYSEASCNLANALIVTEDFDGAIANYLSCLAVIPNQPAAQYNLASALLRKGRTDEAIAHYQKVLQLTPESADAHANLGTALLAKGNVQDAMAEYTKTLQISPENVAALSNLAWLLSTSADVSLRNGSKAVALAERAESASSRSDNYAMVLRIAAAAYAESGRFAEAAKTAKKALETAKGQGNTVLVGALKDELALYELGLPYHK